jgi:SHS2 domain-containing protein
MERYRILDHGGDAKLRAFGQTLEQAFGHAALAVISLMTDWEKVEPRVSRDIAVDGGDLEQLLVKFLNEILYLFDARSFVLGAVADLRLEFAGPGFIPPDAPANPNPGREKGEADVVPASESDGERTAGPPAERPAARLSARLLGDDRPDRYAFHGDVKAVTYNEIKIEACACGPGAWMVQAVVDL